MIRIIALLSILACAKAGNDHGAQTPEVTQSDKKFFGKDYPWDKRPQVDVLHFKHPYPVVQDSGDFDRDFIKDENSDDGSWAAQTEYDRLRHKLLKEKADVTKAQKAKNRAEKDLRDVIRRKDEAQERARIAAQQKRGQVSGGGGDMSKEPARVMEKIKKVFEAPPKLPGGIASPGEVQVATDDTKRAMDALEECKKQLAEAREELKKLVKELDDAKQKQRETESALSGATSHEKDAEAKKETLDQSVKSNYGAYQKAREEYLIQQALVAKMEQDIKAAAAKVKSFRSAEDANGGVYNEAAQNGAASSVPLLSICLAAALVALAH